jgi:uncharacterized protein YfaS (alpha-2-macroglobulin family)/tetratricopeptide (TPR) repeat protein
MKMSRSPLFPLLALLFLWASALPALAQQQEPLEAAVKALDERFAAADKLFKDKNFAEAREAYDKLRAEEKDWTSPATRRAVDGAVACFTELKLWDEAMARADELISHTGGTFEGARAERFRAGLFVNFPHHGVKRGGKFLRGQSGQGVYVQSWRKDQKEAVAGYERARAILRTLIDKPETDPARLAENRAKQLTEELIGLNFDLALTLSTSDMDYYGYNPWGIRGWWWPRGWEDEEESEALEEADYEEPRHWRGRGRGWYGQQEEKPTGIPAGPDGKPRFIAIPDKYTAELGAGQKIRFLLDEIQRVDPSEKKDDAALALYRWATLAAELYGPGLVQRVNGQNVRYDRSGRPLPAEEDPEAPSTRIWELGDDQALTFVSGRVRVVDLPAEESPVALFRRVEEKYPGTASVAKARFALGEYFQGRQQFGKAIAAYEVVVKEHVETSEWNNARHYIEQIRQPAVALGEGRVQLPDSKPRLDFEVRNASSVRFSAKKFDIVRYVRDMLEDPGDDNYWRYSNLSYHLLNDGKERWKKYTGKEAAAWTETFTPEPDHRAGKFHTLAPLPEAGAYIVEASVDGQERPSRILTLVTDVAIVQKQLVGKGLIYVCDARTGQPLADKAVRVYEHWTSYPPNGGKSKPEFQVNTLNTNKDGVIEYKRKRENGGSQVEALVLGEDGRMAFSFFQNWNDYGLPEDSNSGPRHYVVTDRPVYRPGETVKFKAWIRSSRGGHIPPANSGRSVSMSLYDARNNKLDSKTLVTDDMGAVNWEYTLAEEPPLGVYHVNLDSQSPDGRDMAGGIFRVEEYKKPEFEVSVKPSTTQARLGDKFKAVINARYYFGQPVASGEIQYKVFREDYRHVYFEPGEYDWLYGRGYGIYGYAYPWFRWWGRWGCLVWWPDAPWIYTPPYHEFPWGGYGYVDNGRSRRNYWETTTRKALRELVAEGTATLKPDGTYEVEIDSAKAARELPNTDHRYTIEAEVRDASRRTITGSGSVVATRQSFYAFLQTDQGWYPNPTSDVRFRVRTLTPDDVPVTAQGEVAVYKITYPAGEAQPREEEIKRWAAETDPQGGLALSFALPGGGQYRFTFVTKDAWGGEVQGNAIVWAAGPGFDGKEFRFNNLEVIADKRSYKVGETAHLLINTAESNSRVLFSDQVGQGVLRDYKFLDIPGRSLVVDVPITQYRGANFFVEATLVRNGGLYMETRELFVPPERNLLDVKITTDKPQYQAGEKGKVRVEARDHEGKPVSGEVALTVYDEAVTYIQDEYGPSPRVFYYGQKRWHQAFADMSSEFRFQAYGSLPRPEQIGMYRSRGDREWGLEVNGLKLSGLSKDKEQAKGLSGRDMRNPARKSDLLRQEISIADSSSLSGAVSGSGVVGRTAAFAAAEAPAPASAPATRGGFFNSVSSGSPADGAPVEMAAAEIRTNFADTAFWGPSLKLDESGAAETEITFPQSLTTWRLRGYTMTKDTKVGDVTGSATTTKKLIVRLQAPRFFMERDEVVLSANVNNYLPTAQKVRAELSVPAELFGYLGEMGGELAKDEAGNYILVAEREVPANGEHRFDWPVKVLKPGLASITVKALTTQESDGMRMAFPVLVHGINKTVAQSGAYRVAAEGDRVLKLDLPTEIDPEQTKLELTMSPSLGGVMFDALPYLVGYPYGCVEQTMSRFYPTVLVRDTLKKMGTNLGAIGERRKQISAAYLDKRYGKDPVFDSEEVDNMVRAGLERIYNFQQSNGGWGWWREDRASPYQTSYVLQGLHAARQAGVNVDSGIYQRGFEYLKGHIEEELAKDPKDQELGSVQTQAYLAYVLTLEKQNRDETIEAWILKLYEQRDKLNNYGRALLALACHQAERPSEAQMLLRNLLQYVDRDDSNETAWVRTPSEGWWFWWNNDIETNAWALKAIVALDPKSDLAPRLVKWLLNNRANGYYWRSTRDTALVIAAMTDYMRASGEDKPDYTLVVNIDGQPHKEFTVKPEDLLTFDGRVVLHGLHIKPGPHEITLVKKGQGALYYSAYLSYFTKEEDVTGAGNEVFVKREYFRLVPKQETVRLPDQAMLGTPGMGQGTAPGQTGHTELRAGFDRVPLKTGDAVTSGEQIEVVLRITAKNTYDYLAFEDMKPAGCEPVELRSGGRWAGGLCANLELRDEKTVFFIGLLQQGEHVLKYKLRAEIPGKFHALPTTGYAMYAPEIRAISDEMRLEIKDK